jgi:hypothetical protein
VTVPVESFLVTALPYSAAPGEDFHVSLFVTHRLTPDGAEGVVDDFPTVREWTVRLADATFQLGGATTGGTVVEIPVTPLLDQLDPALWTRVFPHSLAVRPWQVPDYTATPWRTFPAHRMQQHALLVHAASIYSSPVSAPGVAGNALTAPLLGTLGLTPRDLDLVRVIEGAHDREITARLNELTAQGGLGGSIVDSTRGQPLLQLVTDVHRARLFYQRAEDATPYQERPTEGESGAPVPKPEPDFHERAALLGDLSPLLRGLGLVIDLHVDDLSQLANLEWIQATLTIPGLANAIGTQPRTACRVLGQTFTATSTSGDYELGMLRLGDETRFTVLDLDPDASALKLEQYVRTLPRLAAAERNGDAVNSAPSTLRATGLAIARINRAQRLHDQLQNAAAKDAALRAGTAPPLDLEQISRGIRLEVWDDASSGWHSLHERLLTVDVDDAGTVLDGAPDAGFLQGAALTHSAAVPDGPKYAHEVLAGWDGWSLSAPRPGKVVVHEAGDEQVLDDPPPDADPVNPVASTSAIAPGTLPRLRYGRRYAFRAYAVDLAGNSRPHALGAATAPPGSPAGGIALDARVAAAQAGGRISEMQTDAISSVSRVAADAIRDSVRMLRPTVVPGPRADDGVRGIEVTTIEATQVPEVDRLVSARLSSRAQKIGVRPVRSRQIDAAFAEAAALTTQLLERTDRQTSAEVAGAALATMLAQQPGLAAAVGRRGAIALADLVAAASELVTTPRPFLRWDPVIEPATVPRHAYSEGESLLRMVIRSGVEQAAPGDLDLTMIPPAAYAAQILAAHADLDLAWRDDSQRHLAPPKTSQFEAELHGMLDAAFGTASPDTAVRSALGISLRESGSLLDDSVADLANPGQRLPQAGVTFHTTPMAEVPEHAAPADLPDGEPLSPGQYVAHDVDQLVLPYLPDPLAAGVSLTFPDAGRDHRLSGLLAIEGTTLRYLGDWPERIPHRLILQSGEVLGAEVEDHVVRIMVPPGEQLRMRMASSLVPESLDLLGLWRSLPPAIRDHPVIAEAARDGWFWWLTPSVEVRLVHAVPRPVEAPRPTVLVPVRAPGDTAVALFGAVDLHGPSTDRIDIEASWSQWVDDVAKPEPERVSGNAAACGTSVAYDEDLVVLAAQDATLPLPDGSTLRLHAAVHQTGDTQHRMIDYRVRATTRYREYFSPQVTPDVDDLSVVGPTRTLDVPSSARPPKVLVRDVLPLFRWEEGTEPDHPFAFRRIRRSGVRIYLERPWYATGDGELLGVLLALGSDAFVHGSVSQWGGDPVWRQQGPALRSRLPLVDLLQVTGLDDRPEAARPVAPPVPRTLVDLDGQPAVWVLGYQPEYSRSRSLWFVDVALDPGAAFWPFVQLAVARYQPSSLPGLHLGPITMCDFAQLAPERIATLSRTDETHARVVVTGPIGHPRTGLSSTIAELPFLAQVAATRTMRARLEQHDPSVGTDLGWVTVAQQDLPILGADATVVSWAGEIALPLPLPLQTPGTSPEWRITLEEWEYLPADTGAGGTGGLEPRIVYADHLLL